MIPFLWMVQADKEDSMIHFREIIRLAKESGKYDFLLIDYAPDNKVAEHVYTKLGFRPTGVFEHGEYELRLDLK